MMIFFIKQKTAYELRISDWRSDVCSSDLLYAFETISAIRSGWTANFDYWPVLSEEQNPQYRHGFVTAYIGQALERLGPDAQGYMCGPPPMIDAGIHALTEAGIGIADIHYDKFTDASTGA